MTSTAQPSDAVPGRYVVIARRYRPQTFEELVGQEHVSRALQQAIVSNRIGHAYLFTGARGTGKTSAARILAKAINCVHGPTPKPCNECDICESVSSGDDVDVLEIDGASNNGVDQVRQLRQNAAVRPTRTRYKIYIIDEVHMLSPSAFNALLKTLEEPPEHVKFIFATTEPQKIPITILSRCQRFDFAGISASSIQQRLAQIATAEGVEVEPEALQILASRAAGSMRDSQSLLEQLLAAGHKRITADDVNQLLGIAPAERLSGLVGHLVNRDAAAALAELDATLAGGVEVGLLLDQLVGYFRDIMAIAVGCSTDQLLYALPSQAEEVALVARQLGVSTILAIGQILDHTAARMRVSMHGRTLVEMAVVRICQLGELDDLAALIAEMRGDVQLPSRGENESRVSRSLPAAPTKSLSQNRLPRGGQAHFAPKTPQNEPVPDGSGISTNPPAKKNTDPAITQNTTSLADTYRQLDQTRSQPAPPLPASARAGLSSPTVASATGSASASDDALSPTHAPDQRQPPLAPSPDATLLRQDPAHRSNSVDDVSPTATEAATPAVDSVLAQFQRAMAEGVTPRPAATQPRPSRREQTAKAADQPFVRRAMELFDAPPDKLRYTPPEGDAN